MDLLPLLDSLTHWTKNKSDSDVYDYLGPVAGPLQVISSSDTILRIFFSFLLLLAFGIY